MNAITATDLAALHDRAQARVAAAVGLHSGTVYEPLRQRYERVRHGAGRPHAAAPLAADLQEIIAADDPALQRMVSRHAERLHGQHPATEHYHAAREAEAAANAMRPQPSARELVADLARRGVIVRAVDGALHVEPAAALSQADREALRINKPAVLAELAARPAEVI